MSMEKEYTIHDTHTRSITALGCSPAKGEIYLGFEDGIVKSFKIDNGSYVQAYSEHKGWITGFLFWPQTKLLFCSSNDSVISVIGAGGNSMDKIYIGVPIYAMALNNRRKEIILGVANGLQFHKLFETKEGFSHYIEPRPNSIIREHSDIVRCIVVLDSRIYSAGYDGALVIYDCHFTGKESAVKSYKNSHAHDAGISCLSVEKDVLENNVWVFTGGFDKTLKVWTGEGKIVHKFEGFITGITGVCYVPKNKTICCVAGTNTAFIYDPKSGEDVTDFIDTFSEETLGNHYLQLLVYLNEYNLMLATTSRKQLIVYRYNSCGCLTSLKYKQPIDSICYTSKIPILIFTGDTNGNVCKWEQRQSNQLIYGSENLMKSEFVAKESSRIQGQSKINNQANNNSAVSNNDQKASRPSSSSQVVLFRKTNVVLKMLFVESLDLVLAACEDACIYVWGFDDEAVKILKNMKYSDIDNSTKEDADTYNYYKEYLKTVSNTQYDFDNNNGFTSDDYEDPQAANAKKDETDSVTNRVAGFVLKKILSEHTSCVTSLVTIDRPDLYNTKYLLSAGWDRRVCIWDLEKLRLFDLFRNKNSNSFEEVELASDGNILDMCYCEKNNYFAYASTDSMCYIRKFASYGSEMVLVNTLQGHLSDVNCIKWLAGKDNWITGGEDGTIRIWSEDCDCLTVVNCGGSINSICIDPSQDVLIVACHDLIKVFEMEEFHLVQTNAGHHDSIRDIAFIPERNHIVSVSWDKTIKVWKSYRKQNLVRKKIEKDHNKKFETWVWDQMKLALKHQNPFDLNTYSEKLNTKTDNHNIINE